MKIFNFILSCILCLVSGVLNVNSQSLCPNTFNCGDTLTDPRDSVKYPTVQIGTQCWFAAALQAYKYLNGDSIPHVTNQNVWNNLTTGAWCYQGNDISNVKAYGGFFYNWYAVMDNRGLCPIGWYVPSFDEWTVLVNYEGGRTPTIADNLKATTAWGSGSSGNNSSGFNGLPSGWRMSSGFGYLGYCCTMWTSSDYNSTIAGSANIDWEVGWGVDLNSGNGEKINGLAVRCFKDY